MADSTANDAPVANTQPTTEVGGAPRSRFDLAVFAGVDSHAVCLIWFGQEEVTVERAAATASEEEEERLRYLEFVQQAAAQALVLAAAAYAYAKQGAGPLRPGVDHVEGTVKAVVGPVYDRFHAVPLDLLKFIDRKVRRRGLLV